MDMKFCRLKREKLTYLALVCACYVIMKALHRFNLIFGQSLEIKHNNSRDLSKPCYITSKQKGRLGNQLFEYAALYSLTRYYNDCVPYLTTEFSNLTNTFDLSIPVFNFIHEESVRIWEIEDDVDETLERLTVEYVRGKSRKQNPNITVKGFYVSYRYFDPFKYDLRKELKFKDDIHNTARSFLAEGVPKELSGHKFVQVGIHVRLTDRDTKGMTELGYIRPPLDYYQHAMEYFQERYKYVQFVVASDDIEWCRENLKAKHIIFSQNDFRVDMAIFSSVDHVITSVGTYGWWAGWFCQGTTVYYANFPPPGTKAARLHAPENWWPPDDEFNHWVPIQ